MFSGHIRLPVSPEGLLWIPPQYHADLRAQCGGDVVLTADPEKCLLLYPRAGWEPIEAKLSRLPSFNPQTRRLQRLMLGYASCAVLDGEGLITIPESLRQFAGLGSNVVLVGQGTKFEIWDAHTWDQLNTPTLILGVHNLAPELAAFTL